MTDRSNTGHRPRYVEFRFENSLRKYEPAPRKMGRPNQSLCKNCSRNSCDSFRQRRLIRLCETRKMYHATSREKASQFIRRKEALVSESASKMSGHVSDFNCSDHYGASCAVKQESLWSIAKSALDQISINRPNEQIQSKPRWDIYVKETPIKQSLKQQLQYQPSPEKPIEQQIHKVKDIDFHIGLVEELHQKIINQYSKISSSPMQNQLINPHDSPAKIVSEVSDQVSLVELVIYNFNCQQESIKSQCQAVEVQQCQRKQKCQQIENQQVQEQIPPHAIISQSINNQLKPQQFILNSVGRIQIKGEKGECFLSARILNKFLKNYSTSSTIIHQVARIYPHLGNLATLLNTGSKVNDNFSHGQQL